MAQIALLIEIVKKQLKAQGKTYSDVASALDLSEASVKRLFAEQNFTLQRLEAIGELLGYDLTELLQLVANQQRQLTRLSVEQEQEIASDIALLLITVSVMNGYSFNDLVDEYTLTEAECIRKLAKLDRLKIIELLPNNRIKLLIAPNFKWLPRGPIQQFFQQKIQQDFFKSSFDKDSDSLSVLNGLLSPASIHELHQRLQRLTSEFNQLIQHDRELPINEKTGITLVLAQRQWAYSIFDQFNKKP
jgi:transcriptional regulator with XRE-family HTH domain